MAAGGSSDDNLEDEEDNSHGVKRVLKPYKPRFHERKKNINLTEDKNKEWQLEDRGEEKRMKFSVITAPLNKSPLTIEKKPIASGFSPIIQNRNLGDFRRNATKNVPDNISKSSNILNTSSDFENRTNNLPSSIEEPLNLIVDGRVIRHVPGMPGPVETESLKSRFSDSSETITPIGSINLKSPQKLQNCSEYFNSPFATTVFNRLVSPTAAKRLEIDEPLNLTSPTSPFSARSAKSHSIVKDVFKYSQQRPTSYLNRLMSPSCSRSISSVPAMLWFPPDESNALKLSNSPVPKPTKVEPKTPIYATSLPTTPSNLNSPLCGTSRRSFFIPPSAYFDPQFACVKPSPSFTEKLSESFKSDPLATIANSDKVSNLTSMAWKAYTFQNTSSTKSEISGVSKSSASNFSNLISTIPTTSTLKGIYSTTTQSKKQVELDTSLNAADDQKSPRERPSSLKLKPYVEDALTSPNTLSLQGRKPTRPTSLDIKPATPTLVSFKSNKATPHLYPAFTPSTPQTPSKDHRHKLTMTKLTYCTLRQPQPCYVVVTMAPCQLSMYSRWRPKKRKFDSSFCSSYDSSRLGVGGTDGGRRYTVAGSGKCHGGTGTDDDYIVVHSSYKYTSEIVSSSPFLRSKKEDRKKKKKLKGNFSGNLRDDKINTEIEKKSDGEPEAMDVHEKVTTEPENPCTNYVKATEQHSEKNEHEAAYSLLSLSSCQPEQNEES